VEELRDKTKKHQITFTAYIDDEPKGQGSFLVEPLQKSHIKYKKFDIVDLEGKDKRLGTLFIDIMFKDRQQHEQQTLETPVTRSHTNILVRKKPADFFANARQPSRNFFNPKGPLTAIKEHISTPVRSSRS
jgi:hypothetical protein